ncbi:MAG: hypothetical protein HW411_966 [Gammaproteobacteria bacterium]|nr:hypothetical protein [Gammaproteobacteria bacterium]
MSKNLIILIFLIIAGYYWHQQKDVAVNLEEIPGLNLTYDDKLSLEEPPIQKKLGSQVQPIRAGGYTITPLASFQAQARVLGAKHYSIDREADLAPVDLALGWGPMAQQEVLDTLSISQSGRFYHWQTDDFPIPRRDIETNSANMHFIPASPAIEKQLKQIDAGDQVKFKGYLVKIDADDGWRWNSSMTRNDTGGGACEVVLIDDITRL